MTHRRGYFFFGSKSAGLIRMPSIVAPSLVVRLTDARDRSRSWIDPKQMRRRLLGGAEVNAVHFPGDEIRIFVECVGYGFRRTATDRDDGQSRVRVEKLRIPHG
jgi:hypothetical protein